MSRDYIIVMVWNPTHNISKVCLYVTLCLVQQLIFLGSLILTSIIKKIFIEGLLSARPCSRPTVPPVKSLWSSFFYWKDMNKKSQRTHGCVVCQMA